MKLSFEKKKNKLKDFNYKKNSEDILFKIKNM